MAQPILQTTTLPYPTSFATIHDRQGAYTKTLNGTTRRAVNSDKYVWSMTFQVLTITEFDAIKAVYDLKETAQFVYGDVSINAVVHIDIGRRTFMPGNPGYYSSVEIILTEA